MKTEKNWKGIRMKVLSLPRKNFPKCVCFKHCWKWEIIFNPRLHFSWHFLQYSSYILRKSVEGIAKAFLINNPIHEAFETFKQNKLKSNPWHFMWYLYCMFPLNCYLLVASYSTSKETETNTVSYVMYLTHQWSLVLCALFHEDGIDTSVWG